MTTHSPDDFRGQAQIDPMFDELPLGVALFDRELRAVRLNAELARLAGRPAAELLGQPVECILPQAAIRAAVEQVFAGGERTPALELSLPSAGPSAAPRRLAVNCYPVREGGATALVGLAVQEVTARGVAEARLQTVHALTASFAAAQSLAEVRRVILDEVTQAVGADGGALLQVAGDELVLDGHGFAAADAGETRRSIAFPRAAHHPDAHVSRSGEPLFFARAGELLERYPDLAHLVAAGQIQATAHLPLRRRGDVIAVLRLHFAAPRAWDDDERAFLTTLADRAAVTYERGRLFDAEREARQAAEETATQLRRLQLVATKITTVLTPAQIVEVIVNDGLAATEGDGGVLALLNDERDTFEVVAFAGIAPAQVAHWRRFPATPGTPMADVVQSGEPLFFSAMDEAFDRYAQLHGGEGSAFRSWAVLPLQGERAALGALSVNFRRPRRFTPEEQVYLLTLARHCAQALERARLYETLAGSEQQLRLIADGLPALIAYVDRARRYQFVNQTYIDWFGSTRRQIVGHTMWEVVGDAAYELVRPGVDRALAGEEVRFERLLPYPGGARFVQATYIPDRAADGGVKGFYVLVVDLTERKRIEEALRDAMEREQALRVQAEDSSRLKDEFLATVSHELRTPLTAFLGYAQLLQSRARDAAYVARTVEKMVRSAKAQAQLIEDLLDISRIVSGRLRIEPAPVNLVEVVRAALDTVRPAAEAKSHRLLVDLPREPLTVFGDANRLQQVVWNLLANASKFTPPGGTIAVLLEADGRDALISVRDTGQGISPAFLPYVFDRFRQADASTNRAAGGLGLGLAIVRHLVELHGGVALAQSDGPGQGATFTVRLPRAGAPPAVPERGAMARTADGRLDLGGLRVVVVDDQPEILELLEEILAAGGAEVRACASARAALAAVLDWRPHVLVSDIAMPGEDGYWLVEQVRALPHGHDAVAAVALTAYVRLEDRLQVLAAGFDQYVPKPVEPAELRDVVARLGRPAPPE